MKNAQSLKDRVSKMIGREIDRCKAQLGPEGWKAHGDWVIENIVAGAKEWLSLQASKGAL